MLYEQEADPQTRVLRSQGGDTGIIDLVLVGNIDQYHLNDLSRKTERCIQRKIRTLIMTTKEFREFRPTLQDRPHFLVWEREGEGGDLRSET